MSRRNYSDSASVGTIQDAINNTDTATTSILSSGTLTGWPSTPCTAALNLTLADEEVVLVTAISGTNVTYTRGYDSTLVRNHSAGATLTHVSIAKDFDEANAHIQAISGVHGTAGNVVGTVDAQSLSNKTLLSPIVADHTNAQHDHSSATQAGAISQASVSGLTAILAAKATDTLVAHLAGSETFAGAKDHTGGLTVNGKAVASVLAGGTLIESGTVGATITGTDWATVTVTFATAFTGTPVVTATATGDASGSPQHIAGVGLRSISNTAVTFHIQNIDDNATTRGYTINWIAVGS